MTLTQRKFIFKSLLTVEIPNYRRVGVWSIRRNYQENTGSYFKNSKTYILRKYGEQSKHGSTKYQRHQ